MGDREDEEQVEDTKDLTVSQQSLQRHDTKVGRLTCPSPVAPVPHPLTVSLPVCVPRQTELTDTVVDGDMTATEVRKSPVDPVLSSRRAAFDASLSPASPIRTKT